MTVKRLTAAIRIPKKPNAIVCRGEEAPFIPELSDQSSRILIQLLDGLAMNCHEGVSVLRGNSDGVVTTLLVGITRPNLRLGYF